MQLNQATDYAFRAVLVLAGLETGKIVDAQTIAASEKIPMRFLLRILRSLVKAGIVKSYRGAGGGYALARPAREVTLLDVVEAVEGPIHINRCLLDPEYCSKRWANRCPMHKALGTIQSAVISGLAGYNLADLAGRS